MVLLLLVSPKLELVLVFDEKFESDLVVGKDFGLSALGLSEFTLTWRRLVPKLLTEGEWCRLTFGWGIFSPNLCSS